MAGPLNSESGPAEQLLEHKTAILELQSQIQSRKRELRTLYGARFIAVFSFVAIYVATTATWRAVDMANVNRIAIPLAGLCGLCAIYLGRKERRRTTETHHEEGTNQTERNSIRKLELNLEIAEEHRLLHAFTLGVPVEQRQFSYKDSLPKELDQLRTDAQHYRRLHNAFQSVIILGSLGTTTAASLAETPSYLKWVTVGLSFAVGASAGFTGYFKYRERSFYLQQTADAIEQHTAAFELGIPPYAGGDEMDNLSKLTKEVESLRVEQRKREQQLDQPHEGRDGTV
ncbi:DUF4231 domain-containing protein [Streptomyces sp. NBC_01465]|uniref:DUF4231 domain-containing protein n=1 Tax=Streptomyces sp. NBC_01465 TaxID=2903878 RepID=UPI002E3696FA|nr:DUF4231 domain-containing protein [Streptomyces sp. NBC_01465]